MKKIISFVVMTALILSLCACGATGNSTAISEKTTAGMKESTQPEQQIETAQTAPSEEVPASNYLRPELIGDLVQMLDGTIMECNTAYGGSRSSAAMHKQVADDYGFTAIADFDLLDEDGEVEWPVTGGKMLDRAIVGSHAENYTDWVILSHFKGHTMAGFGGAIKNVAIGMSSPSSKVYVHTVGTKTSGSIMYSDQDAWLEALGEMVTGVRDHVGLNTSSISMS